MFPIEDMRGSRIDEGREDSNTTISGPSSARQRTAIICPPAKHFAGVLMMAHSNDAEDGPTLNAGLVAL